jgi:hypothetical protein
MMPEGSSKGKWVDEPCNKRNLLVCQRMQTWSLSHLQEVLLDIRKNPVPIGYIHVQLPNQPEPSSLWPTVKWQHISSDYAGHFFRVEGGNAAPHGQSQPDAFQGHDHFNNVYNSTDYGDWYYGSGNLKHDWYVMITARPLNVAHIPVSNGFNGQPRNASETRPINYSVRIWKRVN